MKKLVNVFQGINRKHKKAFLGLDVGTYSIKLAEIALIKDTPILEGFSQVKTFENTVINKIINNSELLKTNLKNLFYNFSPKSKEIFYALPYELTIFGNFPINNPEAIPEIEKGINDEIPYKIEDIYFSYFVFPEKDSFKIYYLVSKKENIDNIKAIISELTYTLENINADFIILHNFLEYLYGPEEKGIIDWGYEKVKIHFSNKDTPIFTRELFKLGLKQLRKEIANELKIPMDLAEKIAHAPPNDTMGKKVKEIYIKYIKQLVEEIKISIDIVQKKFNLNPSVFYLIGGGARLPNLYEILSRLLRIPVKSIKIEEKLRISENIDKNYLKIINTQGILAVATAIQEFI